MFFSANSASLRWGFWLAASLRRVTSMKGISILGSTGSIGVNTLDVIRHFSDRFRVVGLGAGRNIELLRKQALEFRPAIVSVSDMADANEIRNDLECQGIRVVFGQE